MHLSLGAGACRVALTLAAIAIAAPAGAANDSQIWSGGSVTQKLSDKWRFSEEVTARFSDKRNGLYEIESNSLLGYSLGHGVTLWAGYTHDPQYAGDDFTIMEHRAREQVTFDNFATFGGGRFNGRMRVEQRWRSGLGGTGWRVRPYLKYSLPFHKGGKTALVLSTEPFFDLSTTIFQRTRGLDRVRSFIGISTPLAKTLTVEAGYLNQHIFVRSGPDNDDHVASVALNLSLH
jgi:hypothetical protein